MENIMDPEIQREFEEQLRQMNQMLSDINSTMAGTVKSIQNQSSAISGNTTAVRNQTQANDQLSASVSGRTKAEEAASIANEKFSKTTDSLATGFKAVGSSLTTFGSAIRDASAGYSKYSGGITQLTKGVGELASNFGFLGKALGFAVEAVGSIAAPILEYNDALLKGYDELSKFGAGAGLSAEQIMKLGHDANFSSKTLGILTNNAKEMNRSLIAMSGSFTAGVESFSKFIGLTNDQLKQYRNLGFSQEELAESMTKYAAMQAKVGNSMVQTPQQLQKASLAYIDNLVTLAELTGVDVAKMQDAQNQALADENFNAYIFKKQLERDRTTDEAEKAKIQAIIDAKLEYAGTAKATLSATEAAARIQAISTDGMVNFTESNSVLLLQNADIQAQQDKLMRGESQALALQEDNYRIQTNLSDQYGDMIAGLGEAGKEIGSTVGAFNESRESANLFKVNEKELAGLSGEARLARIKELKEEAAARVAGTKGKTTGATADDATKEALERQLNIMTDQFLDPLAAGARKLINEGLELAVTAFTTLNNFLNNDLMPTLIKLKEFFDELPTSIKIASAALLGLAGMGGLGLLKSAILGTAGLLTNTLGGALNGAAGKLKSLLGLGARPTAPNAPVAPPPRLGADGRWRDARGRYATPPTAPAAGAGAGTGRLAGAVGKVGTVLGKLALPLAALGAITVGASEWADASKRTKTGEITEEEASAKKKEAVGGAGGSLAGMLGGAKLGAMIGTMIAPGIGTAVGGVLGGLFGGVLGEGIGRSISEHFSSILDMVIAPVTAVFSPLVAVGSLIKENWESLVSIGQNLFSIATDLVKLAFFPIYWAGQKVSEGLDWIAKKAKPITDVAFPAISAAVEGLRKAISSIINWISNITGDVAGGLKDFVKGLYSDDKKDTKPADQQQQLLRDMERAERQRADRIATPTVAKNPRTGALEPINARSQSEIETQEKLEEKAKVTTEKQSAAATKNEKSTDKTTITTQKYGKYTDEFTRSVQRFANLVVINAKAIHVFALAIGAFEKVIKDLSDKLSEMTFGSTGTLGTKANSPATVDAVMAMNYQKESAGGTQLRVKGMSGAGTIGGGYGLSDASRKSAFESMTDEQKAKFTQETGFTKAPTLNQLVNKEGSAFLSDKARLADTMLSRQFTENTIANLSKRLGRQPTMTDVRGAHWLGDTGYARFMSDLASNPNMTMAEFYDKHKNFGGKRPDMTQFGGGKMTLQQFQEKLIEHAGGADGGGGSDIVALGKQLQSEGLKISGHTEFGGMPAKGIHAENSRHYRDLAIDINAPGSVTEANDPKWKDKFNDLAIRIQNAGFAVKWNDDAGHKNHIHASVGRPEGKIVKAAKGGIFDGPTSGYPAELHGGEMVAPLAMDSILMKLAKTPAVSAEGGMFEKAITGGTGAASSNDNTDAILKMHSELINVLSSKLDNMIDVLDDGNDTREKIFKHSMV